MTCIDPTAAVDLAHALGSDPATRIRHIAGCERCLSSIREAEALASLLASEVPIRPGFSDAVAGSLRRGDPPPPDGGDPGPWTGWVLGWLLAAPTALVAAAAAGTAAPVAVGPKALVVAAVWASAAFWWTARAPMQDPLPHRG